MSQLISIFRALSDRNRLRIMAALEGNTELCACQITALLKVSGATASKHMGILKSSGLVKSRKDGRWVYYSAENKTRDLFPVFEWMAERFANDKEIEKDREDLLRITACAPSKLGGRLKRPLGKNR